MSENMEVWREVDPLTIAYIAIGAYRMIAASPCTAAAAVSEHGGELGFIGECIKHARRMDAVACDDVHAYEIAQPFGEKYAAALILGEAPDVDAIIREITK